MKFTEEDIIYESECGFFFVLKVKKGLSQHCEVMQNKLVHSIRVAIIDYGKDWGKTVDQAIKECKRRAEVITQFSGKDKK